MHICMYSTRHDTFASSIKTLHEFKFINCKALIMICISFIFYYYTLQVVLGAIYALLYHTTVDNGEGAQEEVEIFRSIVSRLHTLVSVIASTRVAFAVLWIYLLWASSLLVQRFLRRLPWKSILGQHHKVEDINVVTAIVRLIVFVVGFLCVAQNFGVDISAVLGILGIGGVAVGFALRDIAQQLLAGLIILGYEPFKMFRSCCSH